MANQRNLALRGACMALIAVATTGCFTTKVYSRATPTGPVFQEGQWFALGGLVELSPPGGALCKQLAYSNSKLSATDVLIDVGLAVGGALAIASRCDASDATCRSTANFAGSLLPWLFGRRTVEYQCAGTTTAGLSGLQDDSSLPGATALPGNDDRRDRSGRAAQSNVGSSLNSFEKR